MMDEFGMAKFIQTITYLPEDTKMKNRRKEEIKEERKEAVEEEKKEENQDGH